MTIGEDAVASFWPSDFGQKYKYNEICCCLRRPPINNRTQQPTKLIRSNGRGMGEDVRPSGNAGGAAFDRSGGDQVGRGEKIL